MKGPSFLQSMFLNHCKRISDGRVRGGEKREKCGRVAMKSGWENGGDYVNSSAKQVSRAGGQGKAQFWALAKPNCSLLRLAYSYTYDRLHDRIGYLPIVQCISKQQYSARMIHGYVVF